MYRNCGDYYYQGERFDVFQVIGTKCYGWISGPVSAAYFDSEEDAIVDARINIRERHQAAARSQNFPTVAERGVW